MSGKTCCAALTPKILAGICNGARGSCKSGSALSLAHQIDRDYKGNSRFFMKPPKGFELKPGEKMPRVVFTPTEFLNMISHEKLPKTLVLFLMRLELLVIQENL